MASISKKKLIPIFTIAGALLMGLLSLYMVMSPQRGAGIEAESLPIAANSAPVTGLWVSTGPSESGLWLKAMQTGNTVRFQLEISRGAPSYNAGLVEGEFELYANRGVFKTAAYGPCEISFLFHAALVQIEESRESMAKQACGFGNGVHANGTLSLKSSEPPAFAYSDPGIGK